MKKLLSGIIFLTLIFGLSACGGSDTVVDAVTILEDAGYELTEHDADARTYFSDNTVADLGLDFDVTALYIGYLDDNNWVQVIGLNNANDAEDLASAFTAEEGKGQLVYQDGNTVVLTYTQETIDLFE
jgi:hypothetical protein